MREDIKALVGKYFKKKPSNSDSIPISGKIYDENELINLIEASLEGWWTDGKWVAKFEKQIKDFLGVKFVHSCNSGSSANLLAFSALCSPTLKSRQIKKGDEVVTVAAGFPTTINPIIQNGCTPVFVDIDKETHNIDIAELKKAISPKTKAVMIAHTLGNPFNIEEVQEVCKKYNLWLIEDNCDALGSKYDGKYTGTFGDISTLSFYPAHHITTAEGGAVITNNPILSNIVRSIRDWGRHCFCPTGMDNSCGKRFKWQLGELPYGYDHKYIYGELGYNLKMSDLHASIGVAQMDKLENFIELRKQNHSLLLEKMKGLEEYFILPKATENSDPSWFGFLLTIKNNKHIKRDNLLNFLNENRISTRLLFSGNILKQPYFTNNTAIEYRVVGNLKNTNNVMNSAFWVGVYPRINTTQINYIFTTIKKYIKNTNIK